MNNEIKLIAKETALMVIDMQNEFISSDGSIGQAEAERGYTRTALIPAVLKVLPE